MFAQELQQYRELCAAKQVLEELIAPTLISIGWALGYQPEYIEGFSVDDHGNVFVSSEYRCRGFTDKEYYEIPVAIMQAEHPSAAAKEYRAFQEAVQAQRELDIKKQTELTLIGDMERRLAELKVKHNV
jgi:hypothetical protein